MLDFLPLLYHYTIKDTVDWLQEAAQHPWKSTIAAALFTFFYLLRLIRPKRKANPQPLRTYKDGVAYIHMFPRSFTKKVVNLSPYAIKVETWCRMNNVPYEIVETSRFSSKEGQIPWMMLDGEETADSSAIINKLRVYFNVETKERNIQQRGIERAISRMLDESFSVLYFWYRYHFQSEEFYKYFNVTTAPKYIRSYIQKQIGKGLAKKAHYMGFSRYGVDATILHGERDLLALEGILGDQPFFLGDNASDIDATVFCHLTQVMYPDMPYPWKEFINNTCPKLKDFMKRMEHRYWPDWDSLVSDGIFE